MKKTKTKKSAEANDTEIDYSIIEDLKMISVSDGSNFFEEQRNIFTEYSTKLIKDLHVAIGSGKTEKILKLAHTLKGSAANIGALSIVKLCSALEADAKASKLGGLQDLLEEIESEISKFYKILNAISPD